MYDDAYKKAYHPLSVQELETHVKNGVTVVDTRHLIDDGIIKGAHWISMNGMICQLISQIVAPESPFILITDQGKEKEII